MARQAVSLATAAAEEAEVVGHDSRRIHVGYYLIDAGRTALEEAVGVRHPPPWLDVARSARARPLSAYAGAITLATLALMAGPLLDIHLQARWPWWGQLAFGLVDAPKHLVERCGVASIYAIRATAQPRHEADVK